MDYGDKYRLDICASIDPPETELEVFLLDKNATVPTRNHPTDAGLDLYALESVFVPLGSTQVIKTGVAIKILEGYVGLLRERSGIGKKGLKVAGGVIDAGFAGDCSILLMNVSYENDCLKDEEDYPRLLGYQVNAGDRVAQLILLPITTPTLRIVDKLWNSERGSKGFSSSGR